jgi:hypothetical protein
MRCGRVIRYISARIPLRSPVRWEDQIIGNTCKDRELAGERVAEVGHIVQEVDLADDVAQGFDEGEVKQASDSPVQAVRIAYVKTLGKLVADRAAARESPDRRSRCPHRETRAQRLRFCPAHSPARSTRRFPSHERRAGQLD